MLCCCIIEGRFWTGDSAGNLHVYSTTNCSHVFSYMFDPSIQSPVVILIYLKNIERVAVGLQNGRVFLVDSTTIPTNFAFAEGSFVLTEICSGQVLHSAVAVLMDETNELWCGETGGKINIFPLNKFGVSGHRELCHSEQPNVSEDVKVARMCSNDQYVYSCLFPGFMVFQWNIATKVIDTKLDCSKLLPCSESLKSISIDEHLSSIKCQISALAAHGNELYVGTTWGCLIVAEVNSLRPITVFRPYENEIKAIVPVPSKTAPLIATIGHRYRSLISRYMDIESSGQQSNTSHIDQNKSPKISPPDVEHNVHCLLWRAKNWT